MLALPALAFNHELAVGAVGNGLYAVACTNVEQDPALIAQYGGTQPEDFWEGKPSNGQARYISQILRNPGTTLNINLPVPDQRHLYTNFAGRQVAHVVIVCHPTPSSNTDPGYTLPQTGSTVPHMQPAGQWPKVIGTRLPLLLFSHGLAGSPISPGHLEALVQLAAQGYVVAAPFHGDPRFSRVRVEDIGDAAFVLTHFDEVVELEAMRPLALKAVVDLMLAHPVFGGAVDPDRIGAFGASMGGQAILNLTGARLTTSLSKACSETARDPRVKAAVGLVPYAGQTFLPSFCDDQSGADSVTVPFLGMAGTEDTTAPVGMTRQAVNRIPASHYLVEMNIPHEFRPEYVGDIITWTSTFLNAYLGNPLDPGAMSRFIRMKSVIGGPNDEMTIDVHQPFANTLGEERVLEYYHPRINHYFMTIEPSDIPIILADGWQPTGYSFKGWRWFQPPSDPALAAAQVCRSYGGLNGGPNSHFFSAEPSECPLADRGWFLEGVVFYARRVGQPGLTCPDGYLKVQRAYNNRFPQNDSNHRFSTSDSTMRDMRRVGWIIEGAVMCSRP
ncbi:hypothetical protein DSM104443_00738 [Usitatibacter rugosus]|uniref:Dienelactone hydrolase n=2 Tax=Usitatibacter rugosus TaxID=2732067 RepID=A0A6M4GS89_9PROT|nr:hypothetical protein DSM104443_00738 [Usitatibacter rugosus]